MNEIQKSSHSVQEWWIYTLVNSNGTAFGFIYASKSASGWGISEELSEATLFLDPTDANAQDAQTWWAGSGEWKRVTVTLERKLG